MTDLDELQELMNMVGTRGWQEILVPLAQERYTTCLDLWMNKGGLSTEMSWKNAGIASVYDFLLRGIPDRIAELQLKVAEASTQRDGDPEQRAPIV